MSAHSYKHSENFASLKAVKETIDKNLTSYQYLSVLDDCIYQALFPIVENTHFLDRYLAQILAWQTSNPKRKISGVGKENLSSMITLFFLHGETGRKFKLLKQMKLDRSILFEALRQWTTILEPHVDSLELDAATLYELVQKTCCVTPDNLILTYNCATYWYKYALDFRTQIIQKYVRLCLNTAQRDYVDLGHSVNLNDMIQVYLMTCGKAIDKCDTDKGALTSHIQNWLKSAKNNVAAKHSSGVVINNQKGLNIVDAIIDDVSDLHISVALHNDMLMQEDIEDTITEVQKIAKIIDPKGYGRLALGIKEYLSKEDREQLLSLAVNPYTDARSYCK